MAAFSIPHLQFAAATTTTAAAKKSHHFAQGRPVWPVLRPSGGGWAAVAARPKGRSSYRRFGAII